ncbi:class I SAM-dependent methyltransferase [Magnetospirillum aberrantis]|uniref:Circularly permuted type 2 ATP-grasp protein n=1 Tax=Magnetospirillum aberrantis SpK TaxID=908842 RepID=A0A7C9UXW0_9PROT|nr:class I SAM-dependent methyltransferase [Magnetospirillum aberrantis]NFV79371.1 circularly permuted type 2 ATP-grasp protein [Magnetospirillum aberrantis SpK]
MTIAVPSGTTPCFGAARLDHDRLWHGLEQAMGDEMAFAALTDGRMGLVSDLVVDVPARVADSVVAAVALLDRTIRRDGVRRSALLLAGHPELLSRSPLSGPLCFDFHLTAHGPRLIEINTNPGGMLIAAAVARAAGVGGDVGDAALAFAGGERVAIIDTSPSRQFLWPEFLLYRRLFRENGKVAEIIDAAHMRFDDDAFDAIYNRLTDFHFTMPEHAALARAWHTDMVRFTPDPAAHAAFSDKRLLVLLSRADALARCGVPPAEAEAVAALVPPTTIVEDGLAEILWERRRHLFFKPATGHAGKAAYRGDKISRATWEGVRCRDYVAQETVAPSCVATPDGQMFKADLRAFSLDGRVVLMTARLYRGQTTNFRTEGGGFAAIRV